MTTYKVVLKRVAFTEVTVEADSAADAKRMLEDEDYVHELFHTAGESWYAPEIKVKSLAKATSAKPA